MMTKNTSITVKKRMFLIVSFLAIIFFSSSNVFLLKAEGISNENKAIVNSIIDIDEKETLYKFSENEDIYLPFLRLSYDKVDIDKEVSNLGITYGNKGVEVNSKTQNIQFLVSNDTVRVNDNMEYAIIASKGNVIIDSNVDKTLVVFASEKLTLTENANIKGDVICFSNSLEIKGNVDGSVVGSSTNLVVSGKISKDLRISTENVDISDDKVGGNLFIETQNQSLSLNEKYPNAEIKVITGQSTSSKVIDIIIGAIKTSLVYTLAYLVLFKATKEKIFSNLLSTINKNFGFSMMSGALCLLAVPLVIMFVFLGIFIGIEEIIIPIAILYVSFVIAVSLLSAFVIGSLIHEYILDKYLNNADLTKRLVCVFFVFLSILLLTNIPKIGIYINMIYMILAIGIVVTYIMKNENKLNRKKKK